MPWLLAQSRRAGRLTGVTSQSCGDFARRVSSLTSLSNSKKRNAKMSDLKTAALEYHANPRPGKLSVELTKATATARDLSLAYSPGVAEPVREIARDPELAYKYTGKGNLVAVISDGTAILGLGNLGPLASKPVMEGKGVLFKRFAGIDVFDIEVDSESPQAFIDTVKRISITFGGINLEDIKAPECFEICLLYTSPSPRDGLLSRMPSSA